MLVVEDDDVTRSMLTIALSDIGPVFAAVDVPQAARSIAALRPRVLVLDLALPEPDDGARLLDHAQRRGIALPPVVVVSGLPDACGRAQRLGAAACFTKPVDVGALLAKVEELAAAEEGLARS